MGIKEVSMREDFFKNLGEWECFLSQLGISDKDDEYIDEVILKVDMNKVGISYQKF